ncbi:tRNA (adenosine(37)-N6)-dimethylallyltransferase MiaA [Amphibacillus xylanus]|uniref:tRNA dimethylallyltransferase n=1 Tax=Amphibacillus xylanus (strain ATCC 51415 / DSM 6626 / JCM 7361 / LMG 17667 / NBRC 15112 / Ep01) TaxID=698758 RepID=K0J352_AMPXN|nr:tRNA (adenosine(37)-N6)-dimethylallyltransferase MiaA [Amphibacillus xylanus]BAM47557.1 tRNA delta(2)-isopentenylpyrophosphate transferase [Amphibacillus xylanus NBRC 15112]
MKEKLAQDRVLVIVGPTAVGKTALSIYLAKQFNGEIISGDSMQIYRGMDIGTAKVTEEEKENIPHHMIDIKDPSESFSVAEFQESVQTHIAEINRRGKLPIIIGGTGLYINAVLYDYQFSDQKRDLSYQAKIEQEIEQFGIEKVYQRLQSLDPIQASQIHPNNVQRVIRALEVIDRTGHTMTELHVNQPKIPRYDSTIIGLNMERTLLYPRINQRVDLMVQKGLIDEARFFYDNGLRDAQSMKAIGYKELIPFFEGECSLEEAIEILKRNSRRYAKRQYTWFRNKLNVDWYSITPDNQELVFEKISADLAGIFENIEN